MTPVTAAYRLLVSVLLGGALGIFYGFLREPGRYHRTLCDLVFSLGAVWAWLLLSFGLCRGDIRVVYLPGMLAGILLWEATAGRWLRPVFAGFWHVAAAIWRMILIPWKKILDFGKILFASVEKWVTIENTRIRKSRQKRRKETHGPEKHPAQTCESGDPSRVQYP